MAKLPDPKEETAEKSKDSCFIITPIGAIDSETFKKTQGLISSVIDPILKEFNFKAVPAYEINSSGSINRQILKSILNDKLVIANLTSLNPNVMYELAVRHAVRLPIIMMAEHGTNLPFDITDQRTIFYFDTLLGSEQAKPLLRKAIKAALVDENIDNPIYQVAEEASIIKATTGKERSFEDYMINRLDQIDSNISSIKQRSIEGENSLLKYGLKQISKFIEVEHRSKLFDTEHTIKLLSRILKEKTTNYTLQPTFSGTIRIEFNKVDNGTFLVIINQLQSSDELRIVNWGD